MYNTTNQFLKRYCILESAHIFLQLGSANLSVMAWIYGGAFISGNSSYKTYGPDYLLDEDIVFVSFNYRLGIFGFLSTGDEVCSGNWGLKDQVLALEWVQDNIAYFGGNPSNVTIFGQSAGGASVSYLLQTNKTKAGRVKISSGYLKTCAETKTAAIGTFFPVPQSAGSFLWNLHVKNH
ncbi:hypothetical protein NQ318_010976 [Aromia moschata]|uniref:Carboxylic ester hydrolase n=1 Tax=Aromia moschata TaxID=1265417 RepID=A0AAV8YMC7_9CUCU|nr:hypothetical protein NQ318_010976 [Aromia moschata]